MAVSGIRVKNEPFAIFIIYHQVAGDGQMGKSTWGGEWGGKNGWSVILYSELGNEDQLSWLVTKPVKLLSFCRVHPTGVLKVLNVFVPVCYALLLYYQEKSLDTSPTWSHSFLQPLLDILPCWPCEILSLIFLPQGRQWRNWFLKFFHQVHPPSQTRETQVLFCSSCFSPHPRP